MEDSLYPMRRLCDVGVTLLDCEHRTPAAAPVGYPYVAIPNIRDGQLDLTGVRRISKEDFDLWTRKTKPKAGDIIMTRRARIGDIAVVPDGLECAIGQNLVILRSNGQQIDQSYLRWALRGPLFEEQKQRFLNVGAVFDSLNCGDIPQFSIPVPPLAVQRSIAAILGALDDKIELNRRMNETLEAIARAIFTSWFVDFDPVRAKMEGRQPFGMDVDTAALFPDSFVESPIGQIPLGWQLGSIGDVAVNTKRPIDPIAVEQGTPYIGLEHMPRQDIALSEWGHAEDVSSAKSQFYRGDILFGKLRPYFHKVGVAAIDGVCSTDIMTVVPKLPHWFGFVLGHLSSQKLIDFADAHSTGTKMPRVNWRDLAMFQVVVPPDPLASAFTTHTTSMIKQINGNIVQTHALSVIRDTLLPELLSGAVRANDRTTEALLSGHST